MTDIDDLQQYLDVGSKYYGSELEVLVEVQHNEDRTDDGSAPDWRTDFRKSYSGDDATAAIGALISRAEVNRLRRIESAARQIAMYLTDGFLRCRVCDFENRTEGIDGLAELNAALAVGQ